MPNRDQDAKAFDLSSASLPRKPPTDISLSDSSILRQSNISLHRLNSTVDINPKGIVSDFDETIARGTGFFHDSHQGRFAWALSQAVGGTTSGSLFSPEEWHRYAKASGQREDAVIKEIARTHVEALGAEGDANSEELALRIEEHLKLLLNSKTTTYQLAKDTEVSLDEGVAKLHGAARERGVPFVICSASSATIVERLWSFLYDGQEESIPRPPIVGNAAKKLEHGFSGADVLDACEQNSIDPETAIMLGDSIGDVAAAFLAGIPDVYIRLPLSGMSEEERERVQMTFTDQVLELPGMHPEISGNVYLINDFSQLRFA
ncbi:HAD family hydrolase [bacterium]|nr:HAD family hydrolase [bacterium]